MLTLTKRFVALFSYKRFVLIFFPYKHIAQKKNSPNTHMKKLLSLMTVLALFLYSQFLWTSGLEDLKADREIINKTVVAYHEPKQCVTLEKWVNLVKIFAFFDSLITIVLPFLVIATMNCLIAWKLLALNKQTRSLFSQAAQRDERNRLSNPNEALFLRRAGSSTTYAARQRKSIKLQRSRRVLFLITLFFLVLNSPIAINKMKYSYRILIIPDNSAAAMAVESNPWDETFERLTCYSYYLNFATNFIFYL
jgi:hypothetical protein